MNIGYRGGKSRELWLGLRERAIEALQRGAPSFTGLMIGGLPGEPDVHIRVTFSREPAADPYIPPSHVSVHPIHPTRRIGATMGHPPVASSHGPRSDVFHYAVKTGTIDPVTQSEPCICGAAVASSVHIGYILSHPQLIEWWRAHWPTCAAEWDAFVQAHPETFR